MSINPLDCARCSECSLNRIRNPIVGSGPGGGLAVVSDSPSLHDSKSRQVLVGPDGHLLNQMLTNVGSSRDEVYATYAVACRNFDKMHDHLPSPPDAIRACRPRLLAELAQADPKLVLTLGVNAAKTLMGGRQPLSEVQGVVEHVGSITPPVLPTYNPTTVYLGDKDAIFEDILSATRRAVRITQGKMEVPDRNEVIPTKHVTTVDHALTIINDLRNGVAGYEIAIDVESDGLDVISAPILQVSVGNEKRSAVFNADTLLHSRSQYAFRDLLLDPRFTWIMHNASFDLQWFLKWWDADIPNVVDTLARAMGTTEHANKVGLKILSREYLNASYYEAEVHRYLNSDKTGWANVPPAILAKYAAKDTVYTARMLPILTDICRDEGTLDLVTNVLEPAQRTFARVQLHGVLIDQTYIAGLEQEWLPKVEESIQKIQDYARSTGWERKKPGTKQKVYEDVVTRTSRTLKSGEIRTTEKVKTKMRYVDTWVDMPLNPASPPQLSAFLYDHLKLKPIKGERKTGQEFRDEYPTHIFSELMAEFGVMNKMLGTYVRGISKEIKADGRVHPSFMLAGARTGRLSMNHPALQTIPREDYLESKFASIKRMFLPSEGFVWSESDFKQLELRVAWHLSQDEGLGEAIMSSDFHRTMAAKMFKLPPAEVNDLMRHASKRVTFGLMYGRKAKAIAEQLTNEGTPTSEETAQGYIDDFFKAAPKYLEWYQEQQKNALTVGRSVTPFGRVRRWSLITRENRQNVLNQAVNFPIQSTASDLNLTAFIRLEPKLREAGLGQVLFPVHDSINAEIREGREKEAVTMIRQEMLLWPFESCAILDADTKIGRTWGDAKEYELDAA